MNKKINIKFTKKTNLFFTCVMCIFLSILQVKMGYITHMKYFHKINKTQQQINHDIATNIELGILRFAPIVIAYIQCNPILHISYALTLATALPTCEMLKMIAKEPRPDDAKKKTSFPSGHTTCAFCSAMTLFLFLRKKNLLNYAVTIVSFVLAFAVAYGRILANRHFPVDTICGAFIGCFFASISYFSITKKHIINFK